MFFPRFSSVTNKTASIARNIITDIFQCKYVSGYGEKILKYLPKNGRNILIFFPSQYGNQQVIITGLYITFVFGMVHIALNKA